jgi:hypothetical protein
MMATTIAVMISLRRRGEGVVPQGQYRPLLTEWSAEC